MVFIGLHDSINIINIVVDSLILLFAIKFEVFGEDKWKAMCVTAGQDVSVQFDIKGAEWQGKYFVNLQAWKVTAIGGQQQNNQPSPQQNQESPQNEDDSNLPF